MFHERYTKSHIAFVCLLYSVPGYVDLLWNVWVIASQYLPLHCYTQSLSSKTVQDMEVHFEFFYSTRVDDEMHMCLHVTACFTHVSIRCENWRKKQEQSDRVHHHSITSNEHALLSFSPCKFNGSIFFYGNSSFIKRLKALVQFN